MTDVPVLASLRISGRRSGDLRLETSESDSGLSESQGQAGRRNRPVAR